MKTRYILATIVIPVAMMFAVNGCEGSGGGSDDGDDKTSVSQITLSSSEADPGQFIKIFHETIK